jgi:uncharacterized protein (DUF1810 family)
MSLERFVQAQEKGGSYERALAELKAGRKSGHWIWWIFPQLKGLGTSHNSTYYGLADEAEARAYMRHPVLTPRYLECIREVRRHLSITGLSPLELMGSEVDVLKLRSSAELMVRHVFASDDIGVQCTLPAILELLLVQNLGWKHPLARIPKGLTDFGQFDQFVVTDMLREGHVLIAGIAGTGKSLLLNTQLLPWLRAQGHHHVVCDYHGDLDPLPRSLVFAPHQQSPAEIMALAGDALSSSAIVQRTDIGWSNGLAWNLFLTDVISLVRSGKAPRKPWFLVVDLSSHLENMEALWGFLPEAKSYGCTIIVTTQGPDRLPVGVTGQFSVLVQFHLAFRSSIEAIAPSDYPQWVKLVGNLKQSYFFLKTRGFSPRGFFLPPGGAR